MTNNEKHNLYSFYQDYAKSVRALAAAFWEVEKFWQICEDLEDETKSPVYMGFQFQSYPFDKSFDEVCNEVEIFKDEVQDWVDNVAPNELGI